MNLATLFLCVSALGFAGCVPLPFRDARTYAVTGRVIDADSKAPLADARIAFLDYERLSLNRPKGSTDGSGRFDLPRSYNYYAFAFFVHDIEGWPLGRWGHFLRFSLPGYQPLTLDLEDAAHERGIFNDNDHRKIRLGDIPLSR